MALTIVWDASPEILKIGSLPLRWYGLLFATPFVVGTPIWHAMFVRAGKSTQEAERVKAYLILGVMCGARLGHVLFYEWAYYKQHLLEIVLPVVFHPEFQFVGFSGLASHGAGIGTVLALFFYVKKLRLSLFPPRIQWIHRKPTQELLWLLDHLAVLVALGGSCVRLGNFANSEVIGKPTGKAYGVVFAREMHRYLATKHGSMVGELAIRKARDGRAEPLKKGHQPLELEIAFHPSLQEAAKLEKFLEINLKNSLLRLAQSDPALVYESYGTPLNYRLTQEPEGKGYRATVHTWGVLRHPAQLYESLSCLLLFIGLFAWWRKKGAVWVPGRMFGTFLCVLGPLRFFYEFYKENQVPFENDMLFNMGQWLTLPWIGLGLFLVLRSRPSASSNPKTESS